MNYPTIQTGIKGTEFEWVPEETYLQPKEGLICKMHRWAIVRNGCILVYKDRYIQYNVNKAVVDYTLKHAVLNVDVDIDGAETKLYEVLYVKETRE